MIFSPLAMLSQVKDQFHQLLSRGESVTCPCCDRFAKIYKYSLTRKQISQLKTFYGFCGYADWVHTSFVAGEMGPADFTKLKHWEFIESKPNTDTQKKCSGQYRVTEKGERFLFNGLTVPTQVIVYNDKVIGFAGRNFTAKDIVEEGGKFDYQKLMAESA